MAAEIKMPKLGMTMAEGKVVAWKAEEGAWIEKASIVLTIETEKVTWEVEAPGSGFLHRLVTEGSVLEVGATLGFLAETVEELKALQNESPVEASKQTEGVESQDAAVPEVKVRPEKDLIRVSPAARRLAKEMEVDLSLVKGTGPGGRITEPDIRKFIEQGQHGPKITPLAQELARQAGLDISKIAGTGEGAKITKEDITNALKARVEKGVMQPIPFSGIRGTIARNMFESLRNTAQVTTFMEADVAGTVQYRELIREKYKKDKDTNISYNDIFIFVVSRVLKQFPIMNSTANSNEILIQDHVNIGIAVALDNNGLIVPVLRDADKKELLQISKESQELIRKARKGELSLDDVTGGTFTITNYGMFGVDGGTPILRYPETGILGLGRIIEKPSVFRGLLCIRPMMTLSLTFDHRVVDGAPSSLFLSTVAQYLSAPLLMMM